MQDERLDIECFYICDHINVPYGQKSQEFMLKQSRLMVLALVSLGIQDILIACNTLTVETIESLRSEFKAIRFVGIEPFVNYLNHPSSDGAKSVGLILTQATFNSIRFKELQKSVDTKNAVDVYPLPNLAELIENHFHQDQNAWAQIKKELAFIHHKKWGHLILGCTHYPLIKHYFEDEFNLVVVDPHAQVIAQLKKVASINSGQGFQEIQYSCDLGIKWNPKCGFTA
jgi:glutamate racemase